MFKILILSIALVFTACQKKSDNKPSMQTDNSLPSQLGQKIYQEQSQQVTHKDTLEGLWQAAPVSEDSMTITMRFRIEKNKATAAAKCEFLSGQEVIDTLYAGGETAFEYTDKNFTVRESLTASSVINGHSCRVSITAETVNYVIDAATGIMTICQAEGDKCNKLTKIAD